MRTAHHRRRIVTSKRKRFPFLKLVLLVVILAAGALMFLRSTKYWNGQDKLSIAVAGAEGDVEVATFDPGEGGITVIFIPGSTQVEAARNFGVWKLSSVPELARSQKVAGTLLPMTLAKNFYFPVFAWADTPARGFWAGGLGNLVRAMFLPYSTNLGVGDKIRLGLFSLGVKNINRSTINLYQDGFLKKTTLKDGSEGYVLSGSISAELGAIFSDRSAGGNLKAQIIDGTFGSDSTESVGKIIEVLGPKVALIKKGEVKEPVCQVSGRPRDLAVRVAWIFGCQVVNGENENFDLTVSLPKSFPDSF